MKKTMIFIGLLLLVGAAFTGIALWLMPHSAALTNVSDEMRHYWWVFAIWRYLLLGLLIWKWPRLCQWYGNKHQWSETEITLACKKRWWALAVIIVFELVVVYRI